MCGLYFAVSTCWWLSQLDGRMHLVSENNGAQNRILYKAWVFDSLARLPNGPRIYLLPTQSISWTIMLFLMNKHIQLIMIYSGIFTVTFCFGPKVIHDRKYLLRTQSYIIFKKLFEMNYIFQSNFYTTNVIFQFYLIEN